MTKTNNSIVSIIIPLYNAEKYILQTIISVEQQVYPNWELILVDDKSSDCSCSVIEEYLSTSVYADKIKLIKKEHNGGAANARNTGLEYVSGRYIAFLDADDIWLPTKLDEQLLFMRQKDVAFSFTSYEYGDEEANETGRIVHAPARLNFRQALSKTVIFTSTVIFDTTKIDKRLLYMPDVPSEDSATWWLILKDGFVAYGMDRVLTVYRRPENSLSSNKKKAVERIWNLYRKVVKISLFASVCHLVGWAFHAVFRRIWLKKIEAHREIKQRFIVICLGFIEFVTLTGVYAYFWFQKYYPIISRPRVSLDGFDLGAGLKLYSRGHILVILLYYFLLYMFMKTYKAEGLGEKRPLTLFLSQMFAIGATNLVSYFQLSLMRNWLVPALPMMVILGIQLLIALLMCMLSYSIYRAAFPARELVLISGHDDTEHLLDRFNTHLEQFYIIKCFSVKDGFSQIQEYCLKNPSGVMFYEVPEEVKGKLIKFCFKNSIRVYIFPEVQDVIIKGSEELHIFQTAVFLLKEYPLQIEQRIIKRFADIVISLMLIVLTSPLMLFIAVLVKCNGKKEILDKRNCYTLNKKEFLLYKFSTTVHQKSGNGKLIAGGEMLRKLKLDELPQLFNILKGDMSFIGPRPVTSELGEQYEKEIPEYINRYKVKAGVIGYAQVYGRYNALPLERLKLDLIYIQNYSMWLDAQLFFLAIKFFFMPDGLDEEY